MKIIFVGGLPRAGSTLLMNILGQNPHVYVTPTSDVVEMWNGMRMWYTSSLATNAQDEDEMVARFRSALRGALFGWAKGYGDKFTYVDKARAWIQHFELLTEVLGHKPKIIVPIRDLRGVLMSMERLFRENTLRIDPAMQANQLQALTTTGRIKMWSAATPVGIAVDRIKDTLLRKIDQHLYIMRYEDLTEDPETELERIYEYLEFNPYKHKFDQIEQLTQEDDRVHGIPNLHSVQGAVRPAREDWDDLLGEEISNAIVGGARWFYEKFYPDRL